MPIAASRDPLYEGFRALDLFTDRHHLIRLFSERIHQFPNAPESILYFHGDGGNGKTLLLRYLKTHCSKQVTDWEYLRSIEPGQEFVDNLVHAAHATPIPAIEHDFAIPGSQNPSIALFALRRGLSGFGLRFPRFDYAAAMYLHKLRKPIRDSFQLPAEEIDFVTSLLDAFSTGGKAAIAKAVLQTFGKYNRDSIDLWRRRRLIDEDNIEWIALADPERDLLPRLPRFLAEDLNASLELPGAPPGVVFLFDTHEAFFSSADRSPALCHEEERWLRTFLTRLDLKRILVAVAGREAPVYWTQLSGQQEAIPAQNLDPHLVGHLSDADARQFLDAAEIAIGDEPLRDRILRECSPTPGEVHPFYLGLVADFVEVCDEQGKAITAADLFADVPGGSIAGTLLDRLLRYAGVETRRAVEVLSACRNFDRDLYRELASPDRELDLPPAASFDRIVRFSFIWKPSANSRTPDGGGYRVHDLIRRLYREQHNSLTGQAHKQLEQVYRSRAASDESAASAAAAVYHRALSEEWAGMAPDGAMWEWTELLHAAFAAGQPGRCRTLLEVRSELPMPGLHAMGAAWSQEGEFWSAQARYEPARSALVAGHDALTRALRFTQNPSDSALFHSLALCEQRLGDLQATLSEHEAAKASYGRAVQAYGQALGLDPNYVSAYNNLGNCERSLGDLQATLSEHESARTSYGRAVQAYGQALGLAPGCVDALNNLGNCERSLGDLQATLRKHESARASYGRAAHAFGQVLGLAPGDVGAHNNLGVCEQKLGDLQASLSEHEAAKASYGRAVQAYRQALDLAPSLVQAHNNLGNCEQSLGGVQTSLSEHEAAKASYGRAIQAYGQALDLAPSFVMAHNNLGVCEAKLGDLQATLSEHESARISYGRAVHAFGQVLGLAPGDVDAHNNLGICERKLGDLQATLSDYEDAKASYGRAVQAFGRALSLAPSYVGAHNNLGLCEQSLGDLQAMLSEYEDAKASYGRAVQAFGQALGLAPSYVGARNNLGVCEAKLGDLQATLGEHESAKASYGRAAQAYGQALSLAPGEVVAHTNLGNCEAKLGQLQASLSEHDAAKASYGRAVQAYSQALGLAPSYVGAHNNLGLCEQWLGDLQAKLSEHEPAKASYGRAVQAYGQALDLAPSFVMAQNNLGNCEMSLGDLQASLSEHEAAKASYGRAVQAYGQALGLAPGDVNAHNNLGLCEQKLGDLQASLSEHEPAKASYRRAIECHERVLSIAPGDTTAPRRIKTCKAKLDSLATHG